jgi:EpsD family peptidyl-prolyl cis-trans isomerase
MKGLSVRLFHIATVLGVCAAVLGGCSKKSDEAAAYRGQVIAHVGDEVVTTQEFENELRITSIPSDKQKDPVVVRKVLGDLVARKYLLQRALAAKLDREPSVLLDLLRAREQVLENAILLRSVTSKAPGKAEVDKYIANNPGKFANRKILSVEQIGFPFGSNGQAVVDANKNAKTLDEVDQQLTSAGIPHARQTSVLNSGDIPQDLYSAIEGKKAEDVLFLRSGPNGIFFKVKGEEVRPLEGEAAANVARQVMRAEALKGEASLAAYSANLEARYQGEYAKIMKPGGDGKN